MDKRESLHGIVVFLLILGVLLVGYLYWVNYKPLQVSSYSLTAFWQDVEDGEIEAVVVEQNEEIPTGVITATNKANVKKEVYAADINAVIDRLQEEAPEVNISIADIAHENAFLKIVPYIILAMAVIVIIFSMMLALQNSTNGNKMMDFGRSPAKVKVEYQHSVNFKSVAGLVEEKQELEEIVDFLKNPKKYKELGARIPKGTLLVGPPGTGKTLLAKAISGEAEVPFLSISGSDFVEMFVGVGASRVRDLFVSARTLAPCIIFIDEIDAVARKRGTGLGGGHDEREQTLNQLLIEMDGFNINEGVIILAATNRVDILDPAILRPGRFDRKVYVGCPDVKGREEILQVHTEKKPLGDDVNLHEMARTTTGFSGADLENLMNEAAIQAARKNQKYITKKDVDAAFIKVGVGTEKKSRIVTEKTKKVTAYHEAGHALLYHLLPDVGPVYAVSIIPTGEGAGGYTMRLPNDNNEDSYITKGMMLQDIMVDFGGRIAEELICEDITTGASQDIKVATQTARAMVTKYGMSEQLGLINYEASDEEEVFLGRDLGHVRSFSEETAKLIDLEVKRIIDDCYKQAKEILVSHMDILHRCANLLIEKDRIDQHEFEQLFETAEPSSKDEI